MLLLWWENGRRKRSSSLKIRDRPYSPDHTMSKYAHNFCWSPRETFLFDKTWCFFLKPFAFDLTWVLHSLQVMKLVFSWFPTCHLKKWNSFSEEFPKWVHTIKTCSFLMAILAKYHLKCPLLFSGMLPDAVLPPSKEHSYAQWMERTYQPRDSRGLQTQPSSVLTQESGAPLTDHVYSQGMKTLSVWLFYSKPLD